MRTVADIARELSEGLTAPQLALLVELIVTVQASRHVTSRVTPQSRSAGAIRSARYRAKVQEIRASAEANDAAGTPENQRHASRVTSRHGVTQHRDLPYLLSSSDSGIREVKKESKEGLRARGTRMTKDAVMSDAARQFTIKYGLEPDLTWAEFIDYWIGVPGQRGIKLDWPATYRNRVRQIAQRGHGNVNGTRKAHGAATAGASFFAGLSEVAADIRGDGGVAGPGDPEIPLGRFNIDG